MAGIQNDEALFGSAIYEQSGIADHVQIGGKRVPLMLMSYLGALKSWIYTPLFRRWRPSAASTRIPMILVGVATICLFWSLTRRISGPRAAMTACALLTADTLFLLTTCFDWGPVALQHLLLVSALLCLVRFHEEGRWQFLAAGFFLFGLGMWDKALFAWVLSGVAIATLAVYPKALWKRFTFHNLTVSTVSFCLGSAPLIVYNIHFPLETFRANAAYTADDVAGKSRLLLATLGGDALLSYIPRDDPAGFPRAPHTPLERSSVWISEKAGGMQLNLFAWTVALALFLTPWLWTTPAGRPLLFTLIAFSVGWLQMLFAKGAGGSVHHVILLWPLPALFVGVALAEASRRIGRIGGPMLAALIALVAGSNLLMTNEYFARLVRNGPRVEWTDAIYPLSDCLKRVKPRAIYILDWGMFDNLVMLNRGSLPLRVGGDPLSKPQMDAEDKRIVLERVAEPGAVFVGHTDGNELFAGVNAKLLAVATEAGYRRESVEQIPDRNGRPVFDVVRFARRSDGVDGQSRVHFP